MEQIAFAKKPSKVFFLVGALLVFLLFGGSFLLHPTLQSFFFKNNIFTNASTVPRAEPLGSVTNENILSSSNSGVTLIDSNTVASAPKVSKKQQTQRQLIQFSLPENVEVEWNGVSIPLNRPFFAKPGLHQVTFRKEGFRPIVRQIEVKANEPTNIQVN